MSSKTAAIMEFYEKKPSYISNTVRKMYPTLSSHAEDIEQETYMRAFQKADTLRDDSNIAAWLFAIARNVSINHLRKVIRHGEIHTNAREELAYMYESIEDTEQSREKAEKRAVMDDAVQSLPSTLREVYDLVIQGMSFAQMEKALGIKRNTVGQRYHRLKNALVARLAEYS